MRLIATSQGIVAAPAHAAARRSWLKRLAALVGAAALARPAQASPTQVQGDSPYIGEIMLFAGTFAPTGWLFCQGQTLNISDYDVLYALLGTVYGGDGQSTFNLPDLRSRVPRHAGTGAGVTYNIGQTGGSETMTLNGFQLPVHNHATNSTGATATSSTAAAATSNTPAGNAPANATGTDVNGEVVAVNAYAAADGSGIEAAAALGNTGGNQSFAIRAATLAINYCIAYEGIFPSQT